MGQRCPSALEMMDWNNVSGEASMDVWSSDGVSPAWALFSPKMLSSNTASQTTIPNLKQQNGFGFIFFNMLSVRDLGLRASRFLPLFMGLAHHLFYCRNTFEYFVEAVSAQGDHAQVQGRLLDLKGVIGLLNQ